MKKVILIALLSYLSKGKIIAQYFNNRDSLKQELVNATHNTDKVDLLYYIGFTYAFVYEDTAIMYANKGLELSRKTGYKLGEARCLQLLDLSLTLLGNFTGGLQYGFDYLSIATNLHDTALMIDARDQLAITYREQEDYNEALKYGHEADVLIRTASSRSFEPALVWGTISSIYERINRLDSALYYGRKAFELNKGWSGIYLKLGNIYTKLGQKDTALYYYRLGIPLAKRSRIYIDLVDMYNKMSEIFEFSGNRDSSMYYANKSVTQEGVATYPEGWLRAVTRLANLYEQQGLKDSTIKYLKLSLALREKLFNREKTREAQSLAFNEKIHQRELATRQEQQQNKIKLYALLIIIAAFLMIAFMQWRNNKHKQKANKILENTLTNLKAAQGQLIQSEKMASLGELTAGIAHEIQNPLNFVNNFSEVNTELIEELKSQKAKVESERDEELESEILNDIADNEQKINHHGKRADAIVKGMLQHSRASSGKKEPTDINGLADEYLRLSYHGFRAKDKSFNATIETHFDESIGKLEVIPQDIGRALLNLFNNAFYAVAEKKKAPTKPEISSGREHYEPTVSVSTKKENDKIIIVVRDNGIGIPQKVVDKIFQPFFTTKPTGQGTGLGLSLSYDIIKAHGGELKVETNEGQGAEFTIKLPLMINTIK